MRHSTQPLTAISLSGDTIGDIKVLLPDLSRLVPGLRFLGYDWPVQDASSTREDLQLLRTFTKLECIRWRGGGSIPDEWRTLASDVLNPQFYAGPSLRAVQMEYPCTIFARNRELEGVWRPSDGHTDRWDFHAGEFITPPLIPGDLSLVRALQRISFESLMSFPV